jgi:hypothetical protein
MIAFIREHPDDYESGFEDVFVKLVIRLDPSPAPDRHHSAGAP